MGRSRQEALSVLGLLTSVRAQGHPEPVSPSSNPTPDTHLAGQQPRAGRRQGVLNGE